MADRIDEGRGHVRRAVALALAVVVLAGVLAGCTAQSAPLPVLPDQSPTTRDGYRVLAGIEQLYVVGALPGDRITVTDQGGAVVGGGTADRYGSLAVRGLAQGGTYAVTDETSGDRREVRILRADEPPPQSFYDATQLHEGLNYVPVRDGITIAATVRPPLGLSLSDGPFPTVVEYSGYQVAAPNEPVLSKLGTLLGFPADELAPGGETDVGSLLVRLAGFATVSVQLRGTGCSGGEADLFDLPSRYDGYDVIETVAAQPWVSGGTVGMVGISFSGFSQIAVASTHPPHLSAIAPMSFSGTLYDIAHPGGIFNDGFARTWMAERVRSARPAPDPGALPYANRLVAVDAQCRENQRLRLQTRDGDGLIRGDAFEGEMYRRRDFREWMGRIEVPTYAFLQFEDEETSSYAALSAADLLGSNDRVWLTLANGHHRDAVSPDTITDWFEFLDIYVAKRPPEVKILVNLLKDVVFGDGSASPPWPRDLATTLDDARASFEARPRVRVLLERPSGSNEGPNTGARWAVEGDRFPLAGSTERTWFMGADGHLTDAPDGAATAASYRPDPAARRRDPGPASEGTTPFAWTPVADGAGTGFVSEPLPADVVAVGPAAASIALTSSATDTDLAVTVSEVRPDGQEMLVGTGVQRASMRTVDPARSTATRPAFTNDRTVPLSGGDVVDRVPVQILPLGHVFRAGSRIRISIAGVNGDRERWAFDSVDPDGPAASRTTDTVHLGGAAPSSVTFTVAPIGPAPAGLLPCPAPGKPCRPWVPAANGG